VYPSGFSCAVKCAAATYIDPLLLIGTQGCPKYFWATVPRALQAKSVDPPAAKEITEMTSFVG